MKPFYLIAVLSCFSAEIMAQGTQTKTASGWQYTSYYPSGQISSIGNFMDSTRHIKNGSMIGFDSSGKPMHFYGYHYNILSGPDTVWFPNGQVRTTGGWKDGKRDGPWEGFYPSGELSGKAVYSKGKASGVVAFKEDGTVNKSVKDFWAVATPPGGLDNWIPYLSHALIYPQDALALHAEGVTIIRFKVAVDGTTSDFSVQKSSGNASLDAEAIDVIKRSGKWYPAIDGGRVIEVYSSQPIIFRINQ